MASELERLNGAYGKQGAVTFVDHPLGGIAAELASPHAKAAVALHGAHVLSFVPNADRDVLWMSPEARIAAGQGIRGGVPVCWPWFATHVSDPQKPDHGFVRKVPWQIRHTAADRETAIIEFGFHTTAEHADLWEGQAELTLRVTLSDRLQVDLTTYNTGDRSFDLTQALHTYFAIGRITDVAVGGLEGRPYLDKLQAYARLVQDGPITFSGEVDRIYQDTIGDVLIDDPDNARRIRVAKQGSTSTVVWNPWIEKSKRLSDMPPEGYQQMLCVETTNAGGDVVTLASRDIHRLTAILSVEPL